MPNTRYVEDAVRAAGTKRMNLTRYLAGAYADIAAAVNSAALPPDAQRRLLGVASRQQSKVPNAISDPLALFYLICRDLSDPSRRPMSTVGAGCLMYFLSLRLVDDAQDGELDTDLYPGAVAAHAMTDALFFFAEALAWLDTGASAVSAQVARKIRALAADVSRRSYVGQELSLSARWETTSSAQALRAAGLKSATTSLLVVSPALLAGCEGEELERYRTLGSRLGSFFQIINDLTDLFGKRSSPDLKAGNGSLLLAFFNQEGTGAERARLQSLLPRLPEALEPIRELLHSSSAMTKLAGVAEALRRDIHEIVSNLPAAGATHRELLSLIDGCAGGFFSTPTLAASGALMRPDTAMDRDLRELVELAASGNPAASLRHRGINLVPWSHTMTTYFPTQRRIYYPDVCGLPEEILPAAASLGPRFTKGIADALALQIAISVLIVSAEAVRLGGEAGGADDQSALERTTRRAIEILERRRPGATARAMAAIKPALRRNSGSQLGPADGDLTSLRQGVGSLAWWRAFVRVARRPAGSQGCKRA